MSAEREQSLSLHSRMLGQIAGGTPALPGEELCDRNREKVFVMRGKWLSRLQTAFPQVTSPALLALGPGRHAAWLARSQRALESGLSHGQAR
jgi:hypothetical protein